METIFKIIIFCLLPVISFSQVPQNPTVEEATQIYRFMSARLSVYDTTEINDTTFIIEGIYADYRPSSVAFAVTDVDSGFVFWSQNCIKWVIDSVLTASGNVLEIRVTRSGTPMNPNMGIGAVLDDAALYATYIPGIDASLQTCIDNDFKGTIANDVNILSAQIGTLEPNQTVTIYQASHGFTLPSYGFIPVYQDTSGKINQANLMHEDSTHAYYIVAIPDADSITLQASGKLVVSGGHGLKVGKSYYTSFWEPIDTLQDDFFIDFLGSPTNDSTMQLGLGLTIKLQQQTRDTVDADYQALLDYWESQAYTLPEIAVRPLQNQLIQDLKTAGVWDKGIMYLFTNDNEDLVKIPITDPGSYPLTANASNVAWTQYVGYKPTNETSSVQRLQFYMPASYKSITITDCTAAGIFQKDGSININHRYFGFYSNSGNAGMLSYRVSTGEWRPYLADASTSTLFTNANDNAAAADTPFLISQGRSAVDAIDMIVNAYEYTGTRNNSAYSQWQTANGQSMSILTNTNANNNSTYTGTPDSNVTVLFFYWGRHLSLVENRAMETAYNTYRNAYYTLKGL